MYWCSNFVHWGEGKTSPTVFWGVSKLVLQYSGGYQNQSHSTLGRLTCRLRLEGEGFGLLRGGDGGDEGGEGAHQLLQWDSVCIYSKCECVCGDACVGVQ